jgi:hypothetical protein
MRRILQNKNAYSGRNDGVYSDVKNQSLAQIKNQINEIRVKQSHSDMKYNYHAAITPVISERKITQTAQGMISKLDRSRSNVVKTS